VALLEHGKPVASAYHERPSAHAEEVLPIVQRLLAEAGWNRGTVDRLGVGVGPGSFTGLRVGIALAEGLALGLDRPVFGVGSLRAMTRGVPSQITGVRCALLDAMRDELFAAAYADSGEEILAACAIARADVKATLERLNAAVLVGEVVPELSLATPQHSGVEVDLPHAHWVGVLATELDERVATVDPIYVRGPGATLPNLPPSPLAARQD
jgi:tRNA threonylcarbamoyladenosine biosynthesis protein TsaB